MDARTDPRTIEPSSDGTRLRIVWQDGHTSEYPPRELRLACRCAGCIEEMTGRRLLDARHVPQDVYPLEIRYVGRYALRFDWSDGHTTGIYPFELLRDICSCEECRRSRKD
jgi:ATP-binding protein involved in chromosome partitioning